MLCLTGGDHALDCQTIPLENKAKEGYQLSRGGPSNRQKNDIKIASLATLFHVQSTLRLNGRLRLLAQSIVSTCASEKREISSGWDTFYIHVSVTMNGHVI